MKKLLNASLVALLLGCGLSAQAQNCTIPAPVIAEVGGQLSVAGSFNSYQWFKDGQIVAGATAASLTPSGSGEYTVRVGLRSSEFHFELSGRNEVSAAQFKLFPNPVTEGRFTVELPDGAKNARLTVVNQLGAIVFVRQIDNGQKQIDVDLSNLPVGLYALNLVNNGASQSKSIVLK